MAIKYRAIATITVFITALQAGQVLIAAEEIGLLQALIDRSNELLQAYSSYEIELEELESRFGPYDQSLLEPLDSMIALMIEARDYQRVAALQERQLQLVRTSLGLEHPDVIPVIEDIIANQIRLEDWPAVSDRLEHIRDVTGANSSFSTMDLLSAIDDQAYWYFSRVYLDASEHSARHFMQARELYREVEALAEDDYGSSSPALFPWLYRRAVVEYQLVQFLNAPDGLGSDTIARLIRKEGRTRLQNTSRLFVDVDAIFGLGTNIPVVDGGQAIGETYLRDGLNFIGRIREIADAEGDTEVLAMAKIYRADFQLLMGFGTAFREYREAQELLREAGISDSKIEEYFNRPSMIPNDRFFTRFDEMVSYQSQIRAQLADQLEEIIHVGVMTAWHESLPAVEKPVSTDSILALEFGYNQVDLSFNISRRGAVSSVDVLAAAPDERRVRRKAARALRDVQFRPAIVDGKAERVRDVQIRYLSLPE